MAKTLLNKNELKTQREDLKRCQRYLPMLQLKKQQLQFEVRRACDALTQLAADEAHVRDAVNTWLEVLDPAELPTLLACLPVAAWQTDTRSIAGIDVPVFAELEFGSRPCDLFATPAWYDDVLAAVRRLTEFALRRSILEEQQARLEQELRVTSQRVNLFEKVKIPEAEENIHAIQIVLGDQLANGVGRAKLVRAKRNARDLAMAEGI